MEKSTFKYRIVKTTYYHRLTYEDGPGSLTCIVSDQKTEIYKEEFIRDEKFNVKDYFPKGLRVSDNDWVTSYYDLEIFNEEDQQWHYEDHITTYVEDDEDY